MSTTTDQLRLADDGTALTTISDDPDGERGEDFTLHLADGDGSVWLKVGRVSLEISLSDEGSVEVTAYALHHELDDQLGSLYVSWQDLPEVRS